MALKNIKVLEFAGLAPGPFCGMILADFGATVIRIDKIRGTNDFDCLSNGKQSLAVNLKSPEGVNIIRKLAKTSDVLIEPFRSGVMEKLGLGPETLLKDNPKLIFARLTGFGQSGLYSKRAGHDINYLAISGLLSMFGRKKEKPLFPCNFASDFAGGGLICSLGILLALFERSNSGLGQVIDSNMVEGTAYVGSWLFRTQKLPIWGQERGDNVLDTGAHFYETYETKDGKFMSVGALEPQFYKELLEGLKLKSEDLNQYDHENGSVVLKKLFLQKTRDEWSKIFDTKDACVFPILDLNEVVENNHNKEQETFVVHEDVVIPKPAPRLSRTPGETQGLKPLACSGETTEDILKSLGYTQAEILKLYESGVVDVLQETSKL